MDHKTTLNNIFSPRKTQFAVPSYQRAFSWDHDKHIKQFMADLQEHPDSMEHYHFGHFLFETSAIEKDKFWIIDGQQRMTTAILFFAAVYRKLIDAPAHAQTARNMLNEYITNADGQQKFKTVDYDNNFYINLIIEDREDKVDTASRRRLKTAFKYLQEEIKNAPIETVLRWKDILENANITTDTVDDKAEAVQVFTFQNDRGKELTNLEKLKATLMMQIFLASKFSEIDPGDSIRFVEREFETIYKAVERLTIMGEDALLNYHTISFFGESDTTLPLIKKVLASQEEEKKQPWIKEFIVDLKRSFEYALNIEEESKGQNHIGDLLFLDQANSFPLLLKLFHYHEKDPQMGSILRLVEIILFRLKYTLGNYYTNYLPSIAYQYDGIDLPALKDLLRHHAKNGFKHYWNFEGDFLKYLNGDNHYWLPSRYLLWKHENQLRNKAKDAPMLYPEFNNLYGPFKLDNTIDHWAPQNPGNIEYDEEFKEKYLHNIGNLVLSSRSRNASDNNNMPEDRSTLSILLSRQVLEPYRASWGKERIRERQQQIVAFSKQYWDPDTVV
jgi:hypothetical protein